MFECSVKRFHSIEDKLYSHCIDLVFDPELFSSIRQCHSENNLTSEKLSRNSSDLSFQSYFSQANHCTDGGGEKVMLESSSSKHSVSLLSLFTSKSRQYSRKKSNRKNSCSFSVKDYASNDDLPARSMTSSDGRDSCIDRTNRIIQSPAMSQYFCQNSNNDSNDGRVQEIVASDVGNVSKLRHSCSLFAPVQSAVTDGSTSTISCARVQNTGLDLIREQNDSHEYEESALRMHCPAFKNSERCRSQMIVLKTRDEMPWMELMLPSLNRNHSTSTPSVNKIEQGGDLMRLETDVSTITEDKHSQRFSALLQTEKWKIGLPATYGPNRLYSEVGNSLNFVRSYMSMNLDLRADKRSGIDKKAPRRSNLSYLFKKSDGRNVTVQQRSNLQKRPSFLHQVLSQNESSSNSLPNAAQDRQASSVQQSCGSYNEIIHTYEFLPRLSADSWIDLHLWNDEPSSWSSMQPCMNLCERERRKQDVIYEIYLTEKHHCQVLNILQQVYIDGLLMKGIINDEQCKNLVPGKMDVLVDFHASLLRRILAERKKSVVVESVSEIFYDEFEKGIENIALINAYTDFCSRSDLCGRLYDQLHSKNADFLRFFDDFDSVHFYKNRSFKTCLLLIAQRPTKYPILLGKLSELVESSAKESSTRALVVVKNFAMRINNAMASREICKRWNLILSRFDKVSIGRLGQNDSFTYDDLVVSGGDDKRKVISISSVQVRSAQKKQRGESDVILVLFDDILIFLTNVGNRTDKYVFFNRGPTACSVVALNKLIIRDAPRSTALFFVVADDPCFDLFTVKFQSRLDREQWKKAIETAKEIAPAQIRKALKYYVNGIEYDKSLEKKRYIAELTTWEEGLISIFEKCAKDEMALSKYTERKAEWFDALRYHMKKLPVIKRSDGFLFLPSEKIKMQIRKKFGELRARRNSCLCRVIDNVDRLIEEDLLSHLDCANGERRMNANAVGTKSNDPNYENEFGIDRMKPRRNFSFNGISECTPQILVRRRSTAPKILEGKVMDDGCYSMNVLVPKISAISYPCKGSSAMDLIRESNHLFVESNIQRKNIAFLEMCMASAMMKRAAISLPTTSYATNSKFHDPLISEKRSIESYLDVQLNEIHLWRSQLEAKEEELKEREAVLKIWEAELKGQEIELKERVADLKVECSTFCQQASPEHSKSVTSHEQLLRNSSNSNMPLHLAEKGARFMRSKK